MNVIRHRCINILKSPVLINNSFIQTGLIRCVAYKSSISLDNLYPGKSLNLTTPQKPPENANEKFSGFIPIDQMQITYSKSTGPGGQNVNKVNTKVDLRFHVESAQWLHEDIKKKLAENMKTKITSDGFLVLRSDVTRSQMLNVADCLEKLRCAIRKAAEPKPVQSPETAERLRRRHEKAMIERLAVKRYRSQIKQDRHDPELI